MTLSLLPVRLEVSPGRRQVRWWRTEGERFTAPFMDDDLRRLRSLAGNREGGVVLGVDSLERRAADPPSELGSLERSGAGPAGAPTACPPTAIAFHISRCGSTLFSRSLASLPDTLVLSEPRLADDILRAHRQDPSITDREREQWLRGAFAAIAHAQRDPPGRFVAKLDCWHLFQLKQVRAAFPDTPLAFLYRDPLEVLVSLVRQPSFTLVRGTVTPEELGITEGARDALSQVELAAAILGAFFRVALECRHHLRPLRYPPVPGAIAAAIPELALTPDERVRMEETSGVHAKEPGRPWVPDSTEKRQNASPEILQAYRIWAKESWEAWREAAGDPSVRSSAFSSNPTGASTTR